MICSLWTPGLKTQTVTVRKPNNINKIVSFIILIPIVACLLTTSGLVI